MNTNGKTCIVIYRIIIIGIVLANREREREREIAHMQR
jgi:hypothetical protein